MKHGDAGIWPHRLGAVLVVGGIAAAFAGVYALGAQPPSWYPRCLFHELTHLHCPGCGSARALHALGRGDFVRALDQNALLVAMLPLLAAWVAVAGWRAVRFNAAPPLAPRGAALGVLLVFVLFFVARNLPWWPVRLLAPG